MTFSPSLNCSPEDILVLHICAAVGDPEQRKLVHDFTVTQLLHTQVRS